MTDEYIKRLILLAKRVEGLNRPDKSWQFQTQLNHLLGYIYALEIIKK